MKPKNVSYKGITGGFRKMPRTMAMRMILADWDKSPTKSEMLLEAMNARLKGATIQEFLRERETVEQEREVVERYLARASGV